MKRAVVCSILAVFGAAATAGSTAAVATSALPKIRHVFVVNLENENFATSWGPASPARYLNNALRPRGVLLTQYYATAHNSLPNYVAQISGQGPNPQTQGDCQIYLDFTQLTSAQDGQAVGHGCVYPAAVHTVADQLTARGFAWKGYMEDMGKSAAQPTCRHPALNSRDDTQRARVGDQYAVRHNPFMYFHSIIDNPACARNVVPLTRLRDDLRSVRTTPNFVYITPNLCNDGHDAPCVDGRPGGLISADRWLRLWIPRILASDAYRSDGAVIITFDEATASDATSCCGEAPGPNSPLPGISGLGGGRVGALVLSRYATPNSASDATYNHYSLLRTIEDTFGLSHLGYAGASSVHSFGRDVLARP